MGVVRDWLWLETQRFGAIVSRRTVMPVIVLGDSYPGEKLRLNKEIGRNIIKVILAIMSEINLGKGNSQVQKLGGYVCVH